MTPLLSIVVPLYNRATLVERALNSCLKQAFTRWEAIVVDDASTDGSADVVARMDDPRIKLIRLPANEGQCVARNTGANAAASEWLLFLDSDDELTDGALDVVWRRIQEVGPNVGRLFFACRWDNGTISPNPPFDGRELGYEGFVRWLEQMHGRPTEAISVVRRSAFAAVSYPNRRSHEGVHNLDFLKQFNWVGLPDVIRLYHLDADNRLMDEGRSLAAILQAAAGHAWMADRGLNDHGAALQRWSPSTYRDYLRSGGIGHLLSGRRARGIALTARAWMQAPFSLRSIAVLACSWLPPRTLAQLKMRWNA